MPITPEQFQAMQQRLAPKTRLPPPEDAVDDESDLHGFIIQLCKSKRWLYLHGNMAKRTRRTIGEPDFVILADGGKVHFLEVKNRTGKLSPAQLAFKVAAETLGTTVHVVRSQGDVLSILCAPCEPNQEATPSCQRRPASQAAGVFGMP